MVKKGLVPNKSASVKLSLLEKTVEKKGKVFHTLLKTRILLWITLNGVKTSQKTDEKRNENRTKDLQFKNDCAILRMLDKLGDSTPTSPEIQMRYRN